MTQTQPRHIPWLDVLRITACFMVVLAHCCDPFVAKFDADRTEFLSGAFWGSLMRASVPLFVMISGVLLLPVRLDTGAFYRRRLSRILWPLVVWSLVTPLFYWAYGHPEAANTGYNLVTWILNFNYTTTPLWYLYMLVGIYLILPISPGLAARNQTIPLHLGHHAVHSLYPRHRSAARLRRQLRPHRYPWRMCLEPVRHFLLLQRIHRLHRSGLLPE